MKIGIDARTLQNHSKYRGIGSYLNQLLEALAEIDQENEYVFYLESGKKPPAVLAAFNKVSFKHVRPPRLSDKKIIRAFINRLPPVKVTPGTVDIFFQPDISGGVPTTVSTLAAFHDLIPYLFEESISRPTSFKGIRPFLAANLSKRKYQVLLKRYHQAKALITLSGASKKDFQTYLDPARTIPITVAHLAASEKKHLELSKTRQEKLLNELEVHPPYLLYVGGIDVRKNVVGAAKTFFELKSDFPALQLVMVGKEFNLARHLSMVGWDETIITNPYYDDIVLPGFVSDEQLQTLYQQAAAFVFPSRYEGFGLPVLEAMQAGCPVVCYDNSSLPEVAVEAFGSIGLDLRCKKL